VKSCLGVVPPVVILLGLALHSAWPRPVHDRDRLAAAAAAAARLLAAQPAGSAAEPTYLARDRWPPAIAALRPASVVIYPGTVDMPTKRLFDGGWGYGFAADRRDLTMLSECWSALGQGMYWHGPC